MIQTTASAAKRLKSGPDHRQKNMGGMIAIMENGVSSCDGPAILIQWFAGVWVDIKAREIAAGNIQANPMALLENVGSRIKPDREWINRLGLHQFFLLDRFPETGANDSVFEI